MIPVGGQKRGPGPVRRGLAAATAAATVVLVARTADLEGVRSSLLGSSALVCAALELELGRPAADGLSGWAELVVDQSPLLAGEKEAVRAWQRSRAAPEPSSAGEGSDGSAAEAEAVSGAVSSAAEGAVSSAVSSAAEGAVSGAVSSAVQSVRETSGAPAGQGPAETVGPEDLQVQNETAGQSARVSKYWKKSAPLKLRSADQGPQILILHTHATEAYTMADGDNYQESDPQRTTDENFNVIRVGEEMKAVFEDMGLSVVHDKSTYDYPGYSGSYARSLAGAQAYLDRYPTIQVILDVHRDAILDRKGRSVAKTVTIDEEETAQVMLVVGTNDSGLKHPHWRRNYTLALKLQGAMLEQDRALPRPIDLRSQRFNQHLTPGCTLVEVGTSGNTLRQALAGARRFARAAGSVYCSCVEGEP